MKKLLPEEVRALGAHHAEREAAKDLSAVMGTLSANPVYDYPVLGKKFSGRDKAERFYQYFFANFSPNVVDAQLLQEWCNESSVAQEYDVTLSFSGKKETYRILGVLFVDGDKLGGETVHASEQAIRRMLGPIFDELEDR
ncbi:MAG: nuclear transport factor 2 family protein [Pseudomonadales bacterium]|nr:nuclear transport factor 2 family protein [Pseudomonadales bacterium]